MWCRGLGWALKAVALLLAAPFALAASEVKSLSLESPSPDAARLVLQLSAAPRHTVFSLDNPDRVVIDLTDARLARSAKLPPAAGPVTAVRSGAPSGRTLRVVLELKRGLVPKVSASGTRLIVDLGAMPAAAAAATVSATAPAAAAPVAVRPAHAPADAGRDIIVAIDAGHGGDDPGAIGKGGTREKDVVLAISRALAKRVDAEPGMRAYLTRNEDRRIPLRDRIDRARRARADIFVSIHADAIDRSDVSGSSVYVLSEKGATSEAARLLADRENAVDLMGGISLGDKNAPLASMLMDVSQKRAIGISMEAAGRVLEKLDGVGTVRKTKVQQAQFVVLKSPDIPSMLVETAYISNRAEERKLASPEHQRAIAEAIFNGVREYFRQSPPDGTLYARQREDRSGGAGPVIAGNTGP